MVVQPKRILKNNKGVALVFAVMILIVAMSLCISITLLSTNTYTTAMRQVSQEQAFYYAKSIGKALSEQLGEDRTGDGYVTSDIINQLDALTKAKTDNTSGELYGTFTIFDESSNVKTTGDLRFYYPVAPNPKNNNNYEPNNQFLYVDVSVGYNGAYSTVTAVFTCIDESDFDQNMYDLFSEYHIYSTHPGSQTFSFANSSTTGTQPSVYLYSGEKEGSNSETYTLDNDINAQLTSTGTIKIASSGSIHSISGNVTSYGDIIVQNANLRSDLMCSSSIVIEKSGYVERNIYSRGSILVKGYGGSDDRVAITDAIYSIGDVTIQKCNNKVSKIVCGANGTVTLTDSTVVEVYTKGNLVLNNSKITGNVYCGGNLTCTNSSMGGTVTVGGNAILKADSGKSTSIANGTTAKGKFYVEGTLDISNTSGDDKIVINGDTRVNQALKYSSFSTSKTYYNTLFKGDVEVGAGCSGEYDAVIYNMHITGGIEFKGKGKITFTPNGKTVTNKTNIEGPLYVYSTDLKAADEQPLNMYGATLGKILCTKNLGTVVTRDVYLSNGNITSTVVANNIYLLDVSLDSATSALYSCGDITIASKNTNVTLSCNITCGMDANTGKNTKLVLRSLKEEHYVLYDSVVGNNIYAKGNCVLGDGSRLKGELVVDGDLTIEGLASLLHNDNEQNINVKGDVWVLGTKMRQYNSMKSKGYLPDSFRESNVSVICQGSIYNSGILGIGVLYGSGDYFPKAETGCLEPACSIKRNTPYIIINEESKNSSGEVTIDISTNPDCIVFVSTSNVKVNGAVHCKTLVVPQNLTGVQFQSVYAERVITPISTASYQGQELINYLNNLRFDGEVVWNASVNYARDSSSTFGMQVGASSSSPSYSSFSVTNKSSIVGMLKINSFCDRLYFNGNITSGKILNYTSTSSSVKDMAGSLLAPNSSVTMGNDSTSASISGDLSAKSLTINAGKVKGNIDLSGKLTVYKASSKVELATSSGNKSVKCTYFSIKYAKVGNGGNVSIKATSSDTCELDNSSTIEGNIQCAVLSIKGGSTVSGSTKTTGNITLENGKLTGNVESGGTIKATTGQLGGSNKYVKGKVITMSSTSYIGGSCSVYITGTSANIIYGNTMTELIVSGTSTNTTSIYSSSASGSTKTAAVFTGQVYVAGILAYYCRPTAGKGLYAQNTSQNFYAGSHTCSGYSCETCSFSKIDGNVYLPKYKATARFTTITGCFDCDVTSGFGTNYLKFTSVSGSITGYNVVLYSSNASSVGSSVSASNNGIKVSGYLRVLTSGTAGRLNIYGEVTCNVLYCNLDGNYNSVSSLSSSYSSYNSAVRSTSYRERITFYDNVKVASGNSCVGNCFLFNTLFSKSTLYATGSMFAQYCIFTAKGIGISGSTVKLGDGSFYLKGEKGSATYVKDSVVRSHVTISKGKGNFTSCTLNSGLTLKWSEFKVWDSFITYHNEYRLNMTMYCPEISLNSTATQEKSTKAALKEYITKCVKYYYIPDGSSGVSFSDTLSGYTYDNNVGNYSTTKQYSVGDYMFYDGKVYKCTRNCVQGEYSSSKSYIVGDIYYKKEGGFMGIGKKTVYYKVTKAGTGSSATTTKLGESYTRPASDISKFFTVGGSSFRNDLGYLYSSSQISYNDFSSAVKNFTSSSDIKFSNVSVSAYLSSNKTISDLSVGSVSLSPNLRQNLEYDYVVFKNEDSKRWISSLTTLSCQVDKIAASKCEYSNHNVTATNRTTTASYSTNASELLLSTANWNPKAIPLDWCIPTNTSAGEKVSLNSHSDNVLTYASKEIKFEISPSPSNIIDFITELVDKGLSAIKITNSLRGFLNLTTDSLYRVSSKNITQVMSTKGSKDMIYFWRDIMDLKKVGDKIDDIGSWNPIELAKQIKDAAKALANPYVERPVGMAFFESGIVPKSLFNARYSGSSAKSSDGLVNWGNKDAVSAISGTLADCSWTFFTCADPTRPYTSAAKDLHIIIPAGVTMNWGKDVENTFNIIGNGRVFLYLQSNTTFVLRGNGAINWTSDATRTLGGLRYVNVDSDKNVTLASKKTDYVSPRLFIVGVGSNINITIEDFQTMAYVYMPNGYNYGGKDNTFKIKASSGFFSDITSWIGKKLTGSASASSSWDVYGMYVTDNFAYGNDASAKVNYYRTYPDLSYTVINGIKYNLSDFWGIPSNLPRSGLSWRYRGTVSY